jgi:arginyl-tRNA synthetase
MHASFDIAASLDRALRTAADTAGLDAKGFSPEMRAADPRHGDFQANGVLAYAKTRKLNPRVVAEQIIAQLSPETATHYTVSVAGPGFINFLLKPETLHGWILAHDSIKHLKSGAASLYQGQRYVVDFSSPNTAKQLHVGHIRGMVIGEAICRLLAFCGAEVIRDNHIGDWGTQFGKLIWGYKHHLEPAALARDPLEELERLYKLTDAATKTDPAVLDAVRAELVLLQSGDAENNALWQKIIALSAGAFTEIYRLLDIHFDHQLGESFYNDKLPRVYTELEAAGLASESQGALVVFHPEHPRFKTQPFLIRKSDGAANYASTDLATMLYRAEHFRADDIAILTDARQADHFEQLWLTTEKWFTQTQRPLPRFTHVSFGSILGEDGKAIKTRSGEPIKLKALLSEAVERAFAIVTAKAPDLPESERRDIADAVGLGAIRYADLAQNRSSDYVFSWDKILSFEGNTAPYLLYAVSRVRSIFKKAGIEPTDAEAMANATPPESLAELNLARKLVAFPVALRLTTEQLRPHFLCTYLYELAGEFSSFYAAEKVIVDDAPARARRLLLCSRTLLFLETGLNLLGLRTLVRM